MLGADGVLAYFPRLIGIGTNIGNARVAGLQVDLNLTDQQYQTGQNEIPNS